MPSIYVEFNGWAEANIEEVMDINGNIVDVSELTSQQLVAQLEKGDYYIDFEEIKDIADDSETDVHYSEVEE